MSKNPKSWRADEGLSLAEVAKRAGIGGTNPARTYDRYERGEQSCPAEVIEFVKKISGGAVDAESWHQARLAFLRADAPVPTTDDARSA